MPVQENLGSPAPKEPCRSPERRGLVGREADLSRILAAVEAGERLITLLGPPGIGKTCLAARAAAELAPRFPGASRVGFVDLSSAGSEADLCFALLSALTARTEESPAPTPTNVALVLEERGRALMVLDNFEQLASAASLLHAWQRAAPELVLLVTSRERLAVDGEHVVELLPLGCPAPGAAAHEVLASEAVQLFQARARDAGARASADVGAIAAIVRRLEGIPLAIELAAARTRLLSPAELAARLGRGEDVLGAATKRSHARHRTLSHAIAWSWGLLGLDEQLALACCSVFPASFLVASAEALVSAGLQAERSAGRGSGATSAVDLIAALREKSLVHAADDDRLALYLSIREFAGKRLLERGLAADARLAHARAFADLARRFNASRLLQEQTPEPSLHAAVRREKADLVAALAYVSALPPSPARASLRAALAAAVAFVSAVPAEVAERELSAVLADPEGLSAEERGVALLARQSALYVLGRFDEALAAAVEVTELPGVPVNLPSFALVNAGVMLRARGDAPAAREYHERAARLLDGASFPRLALINTACMGRLECDLSRLDRARELNTQATELCDRLGDRWLAGLGLANLAQLEQEQRSFERADDLLTRALARFREAGEPQYEAIYAAICGGLYFEWGKLDLARRWYQQGEATLESLTMPFARVLVHGGRASLEALGGNAAEAAAHLELARRQAARAPGAVVRLIVEAHEGTVALARAPAPAADLWRRRLADLTRGDSADAALVRSNIDVRFALRILERALAQLCPVTGAVLRAPRGGLWFSVDGRPPVDLARRGSLRRILGALCEERLSHPGRTLPLPALAARGWPNERILVDAASTRVRVAIATLRKLGLREVLLTRDDGYLLDPEVRLDPS